MLIRVSSLLSSSLIVQGSSSTITYTMRGLLLLFVLPASGFSPGRACGPRRGASVMHETIRERLNADMKTAMKAKEKERLAAIRSMTAAIKQKEVDDRGVEVDDAMTIDLLSKLLKQRRESIQSYTDGGRDELVAEETFAAGVIQEYLPEPLSEEELEAIISAAIEEVGATSVKDMGKVMGIVKPKTQGRTDAGALGNRIKKILG